MTKTKSQPNLSPLLILFLCSLTILATGSGIIQYFYPTSIFTLDMQTKIAVAQRETPFLGMLRDEQGEVFVSGKMKKQPWLHGVGHVLPAALWTFSIPLQHSPYLRNNYRLLHRTLGHLILLSALPLSITPLFFKSAGIFYTHSNPWHFHRPFRSLCLSLSLASDLPEWIQSPLGILEIIGWPTAEVWAYLGSSFLLFTTYKTIESAKARKIAAHKRWATMHTLMGLTIHIERFFVGVVAILGQIIHVHFDQTTKDRLGIPDQPERFSEGEVAAFAFTLWASAGVTLPWAWVMWRRLSEPTSTNSSSSSSSAVG